MILTFCGFLRPHHTSTRRQKQPATPTRLVWLPYTGLDGGKGEGKKGGGENKYASVITFQGYQNSVKTHARGPKVFKVTIMILYLYAQNLNCFGVVNRLHKVYTPLSK